MSTRSPIQDATPSESVIRRTANYKGVDPLELTPLYESIDPDALDALVGRNAANGSGVEVEFTYNGYNVTVTGNGIVHIDEYDTL